MGNGRMGGVGRRVVEWVSGTGTGIGE